MTRPVRPWNLPPNAGGDERPFGPGDCFLMYARSSQLKLLSHTDLMQWKHGADDRVLTLLPYPKSGRSEAPAKVRGLPRRPPVKLDPKTPEEQRAAEAMRRMNRTIARLHELEEALGDPENLWDRLAAAWKAAEDEAVPRMAEIVRQANTLTTHLKGLEHRIRRVLRRTPELTPIDRVQEMDRASMLWLARQPGRNTAERAGPGQRILSIVRHENFDTLENRVLHAYARLAADVAHTWMREHARARHSYRYRQVNDFRKLCRRLALLCAELGIGQAEAGITPNYVLMDDRDYRAIHKAWVRLLRREREVDNLWAWQSESWTDFCVLAVTLSLHALDEARLIAQAPVLWNDEAVGGRWFEQDNPLAVFWLQNSGRIVEVQARPKRVSTQQAMTRAHVWLKVSDLNGDGLQHRVPIWTLHCFEKPVLQTEVDAAALTLAQAQRATSTSAMRHGLVLTQAFDDPAECEAEQAGVHAKGISLDGSGEALEFGMSALGAFVQALVLGASK